MATKRQIVKLASDGEGLDKAFAVSCAKLKPSVDDIFGDRAVFI